MAGTTGTIAFNTVFRLETAQMQQQDQLVLAQGNAAVNLVNTYRALGGGWEIRCQHGPSGPAPAGQPVPEPPQNK